MEEIIKVQRNFQGDIINFQTSAGRIISYRKAVQEAEDGLLTGVTLVTDHNGSAQLLDQTYEDFTQYPSIY